MITNDLLTDQNFEKLSKFISTKMGIKMPHEKKSLLQARLRKRTQILNMQSINQYCDFLFSKEGQSSETQFLIDAISTNKTAFFREAKHFEYLTNNILPQLSRQKDSISIWSAGCSSGEEAYSIAISCEEFLEANPGSFHYQIMGTDISSEVLGKAKTGIYPRKNELNIPEKQLKKYFLKSKDPSRSLIRVVPSLRKNVSFRSLNLNDKNYRISKKFDIIFCRNTLIYFNNLNQESIILKILEQLKSGGYFFIGHSESLFHLKLPLRSVQPTIYIKIN